jgi:hypothetical protein
MAVLWQIENHVEKLEPYGRATERFHNDTGQRGVRAA